MPFTPPAHSGFQWADGQAGGTPLSAANLNGSETDLVGYTQSCVLAYDSYLSTNLPVAQTGLRRSATSTTVAKTELGVIITGAGSTVTLPTGLSAAQASLSYVVKNASSGSITVTTGTTALLDNVTGGIAATTETLTAGAQMNVYIPDTNLTDWIKA